MFANRMLQLPERGYRLHQARRAHRMPARQQATGWVDRESAVERRMTFIDEPSTLAIFAQAEIFIGLQFARCVRVMEFDDVQIFEWITDPSHLVGANGCCPAGSKRMHAWIAKLRVIGFIF